MVLRQFANWRIDEVIVYLLKLVSLVRSFRKASHFTIFAQDQWSCFLRGLDLVFVKDFNCDFLSCYVSYGFVHVSLLNDMLFCCLQGVYFDVILNVFLDSCDCRLDLDVEINPRVLLHDLVVVGLHVDLHFARLVHL